MTDLLNVFGKQTIANIDMSPIDLTGSVRHGTNGTNPRGDPISSLHERVCDDELESSSQEGTTPLEVDLSAPQDLRLDPGARRPKKRHVFSQVRTYRGPETESSGDGEDGVNTGHFGMRRRPKVHK